MPPLFRTSRHLEGITSFLAVQLFQEAQQLEQAGKEVIHLEFGEPDFPTPPATVEAGIRALQQGFTRYTHSMGLLQLREAICQHYHQMHAVEISPQRVLVSTGSSFLLHLLITLLIEPGDEVLLPDPCYACYANYVRIAHGKPVFIPVTEKEGFVLSVEKVRQALSPRTRALIVCSPDNPTGVVIPTEHMQQLAALASDAGIAIISDEIYHGLFYGSQPTTILQYSESNSFVLSSFSKYFAMTGWRLGYLIFPAAMYQPLMRLHQNIMISAMDFVQHAGIAALKETIPVCESYRKEYDLRRQYLLKALPEIGLPLEYTPDGAFYIFVNTRAYGKNSLALARQILHDTHVVLTPGVDFGPGGEGYLRISYASSLHNLQRAVERLKKFFSQLKPA